MNSSSLTNWQDLPLALTTKEVAKILGISAPLVYNIFHREDFPSFRVTDKRWIVTKENLKKWLEEQSQVAK